MSYKRTSPQPVIEGGTGAITMTTAYAPVCAGTTATGALQVASTGLSTSGYVLTSNGASALPSFQAPASGGITTINGDSGSVTGATITLTGGTSGAVFTGSGSTMTMSFNNISLPSSSSSTVGVIRINGIPVINAHQSSASTTYDFFVGQNAGNFTASGSVFGGNTGVGSQSLTALTNGVFNTAIGTTSALSLTTGDKNTALGNDAFRQLVSGDHNTGIGHAAGFFYTGSESHNICINNYGTVGESNTLRIGTATGTGEKQLNKSFIHGIYGISTAVTTSSVPIIDSSGQIVTGTPNSSTISFANDATSATINLATGGAVKTVTLGSTNSTSATTVQSGSGALAITSTNGTLTINSGTGALGISTDASATTVSFATGGAVKGVTLGSTNSTSATTVQSGSGALALTSTNGTWTGNSGTGALGLSTDASATTISIGTGGAVKTITMGSTNTTSTTNLTSGSGGVQVATFLGLPTTSSTVGQIKINGTAAFHTYGTENTFAGSGAGNFTFTGSGDHAGFGYTALAALTSGVANSAFGANSGKALTVGNYNVAVGGAALLTATGDIGNTAVGYSALRTVNVNTSAFNTAVGYNAMYNLATGVLNAGMGYQAGFQHTGAESHNICINSAGVTGESNTLRIGAGAGTGNQQLNKAFIYGIRGITTANADAVAVLVDSAGQLGTVSSSIRYKENVVDMGDVSSPVMKLRPVTFDFIGKPSHKKQVGLIAEEVEHVMPSLVAYNSDGEVESVKYHELPVLLLNELQKVLKRIEVLESKVK